MKFSYTLRGSNEPKVIEADDYALEHGMLHFKRDGKNVATLPADTVVVPGE